MLILFPSDPLQPSKVDSEFTSEHEAALKQFECGLFDLEEAEAGNYQKAFKRLVTKGSKGPAIYRGWMMRAEKYEALYNALKAIDIVLINNPEQYKFCHHLPENYSVIEPWTAKTVVIPKDTDMTGKLAVFGNRPIIVKDYVKSEKTHWHDACFIKDASDAAEVERVTNNFLKFRGNSYTGGLVYREFLDLNFYGEDMRGQPLTEEYRIWVAKGQVFEVVQYAKSNLNLDRKLDLESLQPLIAAVQSNFFSIDVAFTKNYYMADTCIQPSVMKVIELGDGGVGGLPLHYDSDIYYRALKAASHEN